MIKYFRAVILTACFIFSGCHFAKDAGQVTGMAKEFAEEGRMTAKQIEAIKSNAKAVDYSDGVNEQEARALVEKALLDTYPEFLGWNITINDNGTAWRASCKIIDTKTFEVDKKSGIVMPIFEPNQQPFHLIPKKEDK
jgi:hypothetical protein